MQRRFIMLLCLRCCDVTVTLSDEELAFQLRISDEELAQTKILFLKKGFIKDDWELVNWEKRQFSSDSSAARTRAYRDRIKKEKEENEAIEKENVTSQERCSDALDTDTDTDNKKQKPKIAQIALPDWLDEKIWKSFVDYRKGTKFTLHAQRLAINKLDEFRHRGHDPTVVIENSIANGWRGLFEPKVNGHERPRKYNPAEAAIAELEQARARRMAESPDSQVYESIRGKIYQHGEH